MTNIVTGDSINKPEEVIFTEYKVNRREFAQAKFRLSDLSKRNPEPIETIESKNFLVIGVEHEKLTGKQYEGKQRHFDFV
jgi:hypothetical protein